MSKIIQVTDKYRIEVIPHNYQLQEFVEGGELVRNVKTGEMQEKKSGWVKRDIYYANLTSMVKRIASLESNENASNLNEWLARFEEVTNSFNLEK